ncbi:Na+/H+ antiporter NhaA [Vitreoscilla massiliensis]|uniref:Na(+)/H(+) antiporter NhaA n=1 Tax=Vitreoscilla massiliensis TaxID=1689272 RepID=A0ABY4E0N5_9NEIS|nr:Na+/H+ antiporter NhaA [Vitreoscilla massiliensis]UOO89366.1 Na+/H+ antiporter NhaA [Vitreoscilla massiliensis]
MIKRFQVFFASEPAAGIVLMLASVLGLALANSVFAPVYFQILNHSVFGLSILHWINDALMAVFFLYVGLEMKREFIGGALQSLQQRLLPGLAALAGLLVPALIFVAMNWGHPEVMAGWAIPTATDIAFALGVLALLGSRVPSSLKVFLAALAIMDDMAAIVVIALFYSSGLQWLYLLAAALVLLCLYALNRRHVYRHSPYIILGLLLWLLVLKSGIHATLAGVALALTIPLRVVNPHGDGWPPLLQWEHGLQRWVGFLVVPVFGWANAGVSFANISWTDLAQPLVWGIALGLFVGKQVGVFGMVYVGEKLGLLTRPQGANWWHVYGVALLCGIGFTMSLFISVLAFVQPQWQDLSKLGVFAGSLLAGVAGYAVLRLQKPATAEASCVG